MLSRIFVQAAGAALSKLAKAEKVSSAGLALLSAPEQAQTAATKITTGECSVDNQMLEEGHHRRWGWGVGGVFH